MSYKNLEIWKLSRDMVLEIHQMTISLPKFEQFETAQQIRRSSKSVKSTIVEGYGRRKYKSDFIKFLIYSIASNDETIDHLETLYETGSLKETIVYETIHNKLIELGRKINNFLKSVELYHNNFSRSKDV